MQLIGEGEVAGSDGEGGVEMLWGGEVEQVALQGEVLSGASKTLCSVMGSAFGAIPVRGWELLQANAAQVEGLVAVIAHDACVVMCRDVLVANVAGGSFKEELAGSQGGGRCNIVHK